MAADVSWIRAEPHGIHIAPADCWIDPSRPASRALVTHGHSDHARGGHGETIATPATLAIMELRYQTREGAVPVEYGETIRLGGGVAATYIPAGHVLGSAQILLEHAGERVVITGDYKRRPDPTCPPFEVTPCDVFITEATFGLPVFCHPPVEQEIAKLLKAHRDHPGRCVLVGAYALGKAQRLIAELRAADHAEPIYLHGAMVRLCALYEERGIPLGDLRHSLDVLKAELAGQIVIAPPSAIKDRWSRRLPDPVLSVASGWMSVKQRARQSGVELPLVISDHADWNELRETITATEAETVWVTHGREDALVYWSQQQGLTAEPLRIEAYEDGEEEGE